MAPRASIFGCIGPALEPREIAFFREADPWGFILFARNVESPDQIRRLTASLREAVGREAPILIDQEGGRVSRLKPPAWTGWENALAFTESFPSRANRAEAMHLRYLVVASELRALGIDVNCAPMVDIACDQTHPAIRERCYGTGAEEVAAMGRAVADGLLAGGVLPVLKHIPGHGRTPLDSHVDLPTVDLPRAVLDAEDFAPFAALSDLPLGMLAHIVYPAVDPDLPASFSATVERMIREDLGFGGLLMSDDLNMEALSGSIGERAARVMAAGYDLALHCNGAFDEMQAIAAETPALSGRALERHEAAMAQRAALSPGQVDVPGALARIDTLKTKETQHA